MNGLETQLERARMEILLHRQDGATPCVATVDVNAGVSSQKKIKNGMCTFLSKSPKRNVVPIAPEEKVPLWHEIVAWGVMGFPLK